MVLRQSIQVVSVRVGWENDEHVLQTIIDNWHGRGWDLMAATVVVDAVGHSPTHFPYFRAG